MKKTVSLVVDEHGYRLILTTYRLFGVTFFQIETDVDAMQQGFCKPA